MTRLYGIMRCLLIATAIAGLSGAAAIWLIPYDNWLQYAVQQSGKPYLLPLLRDRFFSPQKFGLLRGILPVLAIAYAIGATWIAWQLPRYSATIKHLSTDFERLGQWWLYSFRFIPPPLKYVLAVSIVLLWIKTAYFLQFPIQYDEAWSYNYFIASPLPLSLAAYNNHPLLSLLQRLFQYLPFDMASNLRLPVVLAGMAAVSLQFALVRRLFSVEIAVVSTVFFAFCCPVTFYMLYARGYMFALLFAQLLWANTLLAQSDSRPTASPSLSWQFVNAFFIGLGMYSMPTFIYCLLPFGVAYCWSFVGKRGNACLPFNALTLLIGAAWATLLYLPMLLGTGLSLGASVASAALPYTELLPQTDKYLSLVWYFLTGTVLYYPLVIVLLLLSVAAIRALPQAPQRRVGIYTLAFLSLPLWVWWVQRVWVPERIWTFLAIYMTFMVAIVLAFAQTFVPAEWYKRHRYKIVVLLSAVIMAGNTYVCLQHDFVNWSYQRDRDCRAVAQLMLDADIAQYYTDFDYYQPAVEYYYRLANRPIAAQSATPQSANYAPYIPDSMAYSCIISQREARSSSPLAIPSNYQIVYQNEEVIVAFRQPYHPTQP